MNDFVFSLPDRLGVAQLHWLALTCVAYGLALRVYRRSGGNPFFLPVLVAVLIVLGVLWLTDTRYSSYQAGNQLLVWLIGPATVALAVPLYVHLSRLRAVWLPVLLALTAGAVTAVVATIAIAWVLGAERLTWASLAPKSLTMPIAMDVADLAGGIAALASIGVALTGIFSAMVAGRLFNFMGIADPRTVGFSLGLTAHAIGVARAFQLNETAGAFAALAMGLHAIFGAILIPLIFGFLG